ALRPGSHTAREYRRALGFPRPLPAPLRPAFEIPGVPAEAPFGDLSGIRGLRKVGTEKVGRFVADKFERGNAAAFPAPGENTPRPTELMRFWVSRNPRVLVKCVTKTPSSELVTVLKTAQFDLPIPDSLLQLPKG